MEHSFQLSNPPSGPKSVHVPLSLWKGRASVLLFSPPALTYSLKTYKGVERNTNLGKGGTFQRSSILPQLHLEMPLWSNNKKEIVKPSAGNKLSSTYSPPQRISFPPSLPSHSFESLLGWKSRLEVASPHPPQVSPRPQLCFH